MICSGSPASLYIGIFIVLAMISPVGVFTFKLSIINGSFDSRTIESVSIKSSKSSFILKISKSVLPITSLFFKPNIFSNSLFQMVYLRFLETSFEKIPTGKLLISWFKNSFCLSVSNSLFFLDVISSSFIEILGSSSFIKEIFAKNQSLLSFTVNSNSYLIASPEINTLLIRSSNLAPKSAFPNSITFLPLISFNGSSSFELSLLQTLIMV